jgi:hypothetical protein
MRISKNYQIMSFKHKYGNLYTRRKDGTFMLTLEPNYTEEGLMKQPDTVVYSVKYLPTNEIFTIGDTVTYKSNNYKIEKFLIQRSGITAIGGKFDIKLSILKTIETNKEMKKYSLKEIVNGKIAVLVPSRIEAKILIQNLWDQKLIDQHNYSVFMDTTFENKINFEMFIENNRIHWQGDYNGMYFLQNQSGVKECISYSSLDLKMPKPTGFKLIKEYPGSHALGYYEKYTTGELSKYPEFWEPVYEEQKVEFTAGDKKMKVVITKEKITVGDEKISPKFLKDLLEDMNMNEFTDRPSAYKVTFPFVKIGCTTFRMEEIDKAISEYNRLNRI